jgi:hypothetical protein
LGVYLYLVVNLLNESNFHWHFAYQIKNEKILKCNKMTYSEIYKILFLEKIKLIKKIIMFTIFLKIIVSGSVKQHEAQI